MQNLKYALWGLVKFPVVVCVLVWECFVELGQGTNE
jgi:hypothetical protein